MRVAFTGASSTGKTSVAVRLMKDDSFLARVDVFIPSNGRRILDELGFAGLDSMTREQTSLYELAYFANKFGQEANKARLLTDRSFVDVAAYWMERDAIGLSQYLVDLLVEPAQMLASHYNLHVLFPFGAIPLEHDGRRSAGEEFHWRIDARIRELLSKWELRYIELDQVDINERVKLIKDTVLSAPA